MAKVSANANDREQDLQHHLDQVMQNITITTAPVVIIGVQRKANIGNFENVDAYCAIALPQPHLDLTDPEKLREGLIEAIGFGFDVASRETAARYNKIKEINRD